MNNRNLSSIKSNNNCSKFNSNNNFVLDSKTRLKDDNCNESGGDKQNDNINDYMLSNYASCECNLNNVLKTSVQNNGITVKDGYGLSECNIDSDSQLRIGDFKRHYKSDLQLFPRPYLTTPSVASGKYNPNLESRLLSSLGAQKHSQMQNYNQNYVMTPLVPNLLNNVQNTKNIIQPGVRGGVNTTNMLIQSDWEKRNGGSISNMLKNKYSSFFN